VSEPPVHVHQDGVTPHPKHVGARWIDLLLAASAIVISTVSLFIASQHAKTQERLVAATSWPFLQFRTGNSDQQNKPVIEMSVINSGQGPALLKYVGVSYEGRPVHGAYDLMRACCGFHPLSVDEARKFRIGTTFLGGVVISPHDELRFFAFEDTGPPSHELWRQMDGVRFKLKFDACYCSVLGECWRSDLKGLEPVKVETCPTSGGYKE
jgi:hypothetical protein